MKIKACETAFNELLFRAPLENELPFSVPRFRNRVTMILNIKGPTEVFYFVQVRNWLGAALLEIFQRHREYG